MAASFHAGGAGGDLLQKIIPHGAALCHKVRAYEPLYLEVTGSSKWALISRAASRIQPLTDCSVRPYRLAISAHDSPVIKRAIRTSRCFTDKCSSAWSMSSLSMERDPASIEFRLGSVSTMRTLSASSAHTGWSSETRF